MAERAASSVPQDRARRALIGMGKRHEHAAAGSVEALVLRATLGALVLIGFDLALGAFVVLDGKDGRELPQLALGARHRRPVALRSVTPFGHWALDRLRCPWNPLGELSFFRWACLSARAIA